MQPIALSCHPLSPPHCHHSSTMPQLSGHRLTPPDTKRNPTHREHVCTLQVYALRRLARGLGSGRAASRQGFSTALASLLAGSVDGGQKLVGVPELMVLLEGSLEATGSGKGGVSGCVSTSLTQYSTTVRNS